MCGGELQRRCTERPGNLTRCRTFLNKSVTPAAVEMLAAPADEAAEREKAREELDELVPRYGWDDLGDAARNIYSTSDFVPIAVDLERLWPEAETRMQLDRVEIGSERLRPRSRQCSRN